MPVRGPRRPGPRARSRRARLGGGRRRGRSRRHDRRRRSAPGAPTRGRQHSARAARRSPPPRHAEHGARERVRGSRVRRLCVRRLRRGDRRLPVRAARDRQRRDRGSRLPARGRTRRDRDRPRRACRGCRVARRRPRPRPPRERLPGRSPGAGGPVTETLERPSASARALARVRESLARIPLVAFLGVAAAAAGAIVLTLRLVTDLRTKPLFEDEAVAGLVAARPLGEVFHTVWWERGGSPLHFLLAHLALAPDGSPFALRWLSFVFAIASVPVAWDLGRRLAGGVAAGTTALAVAVSSLLLVYGSFGRMYSLYVFAAALAVDLFVRAERLRSRRAVLAAGLAAWLVPAVHPYGIFLVAAEALVALVLWRGRNLRAAVPVALVGLALVPFVVADLRLAGRFGVGVSGGSSVAGPRDAWSQIGGAFEATAGGAGWTLVLAAVLAAVGAGVLAKRREWPFLGVFALAATLPPILLLVARAGSQPGLSPRHFAYLVPFFAAAIGVAVGRAVRARGAVAAGLALAAVGTILVVSPLGGIRDPRDWRNDVLGGGPPGDALGSPERLAGPSAWLRRTVVPDAVLYPYSTAFLAALPTTRHATALPYAQRETVLRALDRVDTPAPELVVSVPIGASGLDASRLERLLGRRYDVTRFGPWLLLRGGRPYADDHAVLLGAYEALAAARASTVGARTDELDWYYKTTLSVLCGALREGFSSRCPPEEIPWLQPGAGRPARNQ